MILVYGLFQVLWVILQAVGWILFWMAMTVFFILWLIVSIPLRVIRG